MLSSGVARLARHAFTELVNNAIDHSSDSSVTVSMRQTPAHVQLLVSDSTCRIDTLLREHSADGAGYGFERTVVPLGR